MDLLFAYRAREEEIRRENHEALVGFVVFSPDL
jgi:hypothetical protein